ncbi:aminotransferase class I/II-fold pyridoxal phosphate-dependent enzyme [Cyclobacterium jeungdonense]|uniref:Aminotransferase class I/II-fold pyridoxal phosphate-dependent enzyme n=1 Tax=Cyclobacterium jeungdonense TaxID=708087 RepID=A0ABT8C670_9BACT|nr:aminotransferase class I/II-fold pyridoxal phosphate-dependent enzyme [Cyclobacterium jeungdonense]MDN3687872.1 aminotransferase class I/II-fold pyridoxal phosphate-dependent enzyme [Cyclobacterium jeungdonense]
MSHTYPTSQLGRTITYQGKDYLHFSGTSYLGMGILPEFKELLIQGIHKHGPNHGSSRNSNVQLSLYDAFEARFAAGSGAAEAAVLSSGYMAGQLAVCTLRPLADLTWTAPDTHPAITLENQHPIGLSHKQWQKKCIAKSHELIGQKILLLSNAVNPLIPEIHDFEWTKKLSPANKYYLLIDDSHAFGLLGKGIFGTFAQWKHLPVEVLVAGSLGKALALPAGIILGNHSLISRVRENPIYRTSSPPAPAFLSAFLDGQDYYLKQQQKLKENLQQIASALKGMGSFKFLPQYPVISFEPESWVERLHQIGFILSSFPYPLQDSPAVNRIVLSAWHLPSDLEALVLALKKLSNG